MYNIYRIINSILESLLYIAWTAIGLIVLDKTAEEMEHFIMTGEFENTNVSRERQSSRDDYEERPIRRRSESGSGNGNRAF